MTTKTNAKSYSFSTDDPAKFAELDAAVRELLDRFGVEDAAAGADEADGAREDEPEGEVADAALEELDGLFALASALVDHGTGVGRLAAAGLYALANDAVETVALDAAALREWALDGDRSDYAVAKALSAEALVGAAAKALGARRVDAAAELLGAACKQAAELLGVRVVDTLK